MANTSVLLVEDNDDDAELTMRAFRKHNVANVVHRAADGQQALDFLFGSNEPPALVLLDLKLPLVDGLDVLRRMRDDERTRFLPVVVLTSSSEERDIVESYRLGANSYVRKPVDFDQFLEAARQLGLYWIVLNKRVADPATPAAAMTGGS